MHHTKGLRAIMHLEDQRLKQAGEKGQWNQSIASLHSELIKDSRNEANLRCDSGWIF